MGTLGSEVLLYAHSPLNTQYACTVVIAFHDIIIIIPITHRQAAAAEDIMVAVFIIYLYDYWTVKRRLFGNGYSTAVGIVTIL